MDILHHSPLGQTQSNPTHYDPQLLFKIPRTAARTSLNIDKHLPFIGHDRWHLFELSWLNARGLPHTECATLLIPVDSPYLVESKSLKLYLNSLNQERFNDPKDVHARIEKDLNDCLETEVILSWGIPPLLMKPEGLCLDLQNIECTVYDHIDPSYLSATSQNIVSETLWTNLFRSNCPVTGQPDWASVHITYQGPALDHEGLLRYLISFRQHQGFHEQCVERIFLDLLQYGQCQSLSVEARFTRRGGIDINPWRATPDVITPIMFRDLRQ